MTQRQRTLMVVALPLLLVGCAGYAMSPQHGASFLPSFDSSPRASTGIVVTKTSDQGPGSLRAAVSIAKAGDTITFRLRRGASIALSTPIAISRNLTITGPGAKDLAVTGSGRTQIFTVGARVSVTIADISLEKGRASLGGAVSNSGSLTLQGDVFSSNTAVSKAARAVSREISHFDPRPNGHGSPARKHPALRPALTSDTARLGGGGAVYNAPHATLEISTTAFSRNKAALGGAIYNEGKLVATSSTFSGNVAGSASVAYGTGGAIAQDVGTTNLVGDTFSSNDAVGASGGLGGAIYAGAGELTIAQTSFTGNDAGGTGFGYGGAIYDDQHVSGSKNTFKNNVAYGTANAGYAYGGAIYAGAGVTMTGTTFTSNTARGGSASIFGYAYGGAIDSELAGSFASTTFTGNNAEGGSNGSAVGGAVYLAGGNSSWSSVTLSGNKATATVGNSFAAGGGVASFGPLTISGRSAFSGNTAAASASSIGGEGGAIAVEVGPFTFTGTVSGNSATTQGGGIWLDDTATITNASISQNSVTGVQSADDGGAGIYNALGGSLTLSASAVIQNVSSGSVADTGGAGMFNAGTASITNCTISTNASSSDGGGLENDAVGTLQLANVTLFANTATGNGGNLKNLYSDSSMSLTNSILGGGMQSGSPNDVSNDGTITSGDYNIVQTTPSGNAIAGTTAHDLAVDPQLAALANNGGPTLTNADSSTSPGTAHVPFNACLAVNVTVDQRGDPRDATHNGFCDVGAYEDQTP